MAIWSEECFVCIYSNVMADSEPCKTCIDNKKSIVVTDKTNEPKYYDNHYQGSIQPIEYMQANMSPEAFQGFLRGNIIKYACRLGKKDAAEKEAQKICRYAEWLLQAVKGETIDPRKG